MILKRLIFIDRLRRSEGLAHHPSALSGWDHKRFGRGVVDAEAALKADLPDPDDLVCADDIAENDIF